MIRGLPLTTYAPRGRGGQVCYTFPLRITCQNKGGEGVQKACKIAYVINGRPLRCCGVSIHQGPLIGEEGDPDVACRSLEKAMSPCRV